MCLLHLQHSVLLHSLCRKIPGDQWGVGFRPQFLLRAIHPVYLHSMPVIFPQYTRINAHIHSVIKPNFLWVWDVLEYNHVKRMILRAMLASTKAVGLLYLANLLYIWVQKMCILSWVTICFIILNILLYKRILARPSNLVFIDFFICRMSIEHFCYIVLEFHEQQKCIIQNSNLFKARNSYFIE